MNQKKMLLFAMILSCPFILSAENQPEKMRARMEEPKEMQTKDQERFQKLVDNSAEVYSAIAKGAHGEVPAKVRANARCVAVIPNAVTGAIIVGGTHGAGLASCKDSNNVWSQPAAISLNQASIGLQAGAKSTDLIMYFQSKEAVKALKSGDFTIGSDVSAVAGNFDNSLDASAAGIIVYTRTEGLFAGAAVNGGKIGKNQDDLDRFYGKKVNYTNLLECRESPDSSGYSDKLTKLLP